MVSQRSSKASQSACALPQAEILGAVDYEGGARDHAPNMNNMFTSYQSTLYGYRAVLTGPRQLVSPTCAQLVGVLLGSSCKRGT